MSVDIKVPSVGESITEGTIARWLKKDGDIIALNDPLFELETEKAITEVPASTAGKLVIQMKEGQTVPIGSVIGRIEPASAGDAQPNAARPKETKRDEKPAAQ